jgi:hypothetical protein
MGSFTIEPLAGSTYTAAIKFPDGSGLRVKLPEVRPAGVSLHLWQQPDAVRLTIGLSKPGKGAENFTLAALQNSGQVSTYTLQLYNGFNEVSLQKTDFSTGILRLTIFNNSGLPVAERIAFVNKHDLRPPILRTDTLSFLPHGLNDWSMVVKNNADEPVSGNFSVSVTDGEAFEESIGQNIYSALLLSPELKGDVYNPGYYFENESDTLAQQLDLVMLTNGWRHFSWQKILDNEPFPLRFPVERSMFIAGKILDYHALPDARQLNVKLLIFNHDSTKFVGYAEPDSTGSFITRDFNHQGLSDIYLQATDKKNHKNRQFKFTLLPAVGDSLQRIRADVFSEPDRPDITGYFISRAQAESQNRAFADNIMLKTVNVKSTKITLTEKVIAGHVSPKYASGREFTLDLINNPTVDMSLIDYIRGKFTGLQILGSEADPKFIYQGGNTLGFHTGSDTADMYKPYFYLNEAPVKYESIEDISLLEIALIRFIPPPVWFAPFNGGNEGAIMIYTKKQSDEVTKLGRVSAEYDHFVFNGYSITREYSSPDYTQLKQQGLLDDRITVYWTHDIETDANGVLKFKFKNTDIAKTYRVVIQGMDAQGRLLYFDKEIGK